MMNESSHHKDHDLDFLSPEGQQRHDTMLDELTVALGTVQAQRRTKRRITLTACSAVLLIALTTWVINLNQGNPQTPINDQITENVTHPSTDQPIVTNESPTLPPASYLTRVNAPKSKRWTTTSTADLQTQAQTVGNPQRIQRITNDDDFIQLLETTGHNSIGLIRSQGATTLSGDTSGIRLAQPATAAPPATPVDSAPGDDERESSPESTPVPSLAASYALSN